MFKKQCSMMLDRSTNLSEPRHHASSKINKPRNVVGRMKWDDALRCWAAILAHQGKFQGQHLPLLSCHFLDGRPKFLNFQPQPGKKSLIQTLHPSSQKLCGCLCPPLCPIKSNLDHLVLGTIFNTNLISIYFHFLVTQTNHVYRLMALKQSCQ